MIVLSSLIAIIYVWILIETLYLKPVTEGIEASEAPISLLLPTWILVLASLWFGFNAEFTVELTNTAAEGLFNGRFGMDATIMGAEGRQ